jgi:hypothetical protein
VDDGQHPLRGAVVDHDLAQLCTKNELQVKRIVITGHTVGLVVVPLEYLLRLGDLVLAPSTAIGRRDVVVLQRVRQVVCVREEEVLGHIDELKETHVVRLSNL